MAAPMDIRYTSPLHFLCSKNFHMHVFSKRSFLCMHIAGICSIFITGFLSGICSKFLSGFLPTFLAHIPGRIPANLNISLQIPQGVHTDSCRNLYKKNQTVKGIPARNLVSFSCGNTAVFLLDNFTSITKRLPGDIVFLIKHYFNFILQTVVRLYKLTGPLLYTLSPFSETLNNKHCALVYFLN